MILYIYSVGTFFRTFGFRCTEAYRLAGIVEGLLSYDNRDFIGLLRLTFVYVSAMLLTLLKSAISIFGGWIPNSYDTRTEIVGYGDKSRDKYAVF